MLDGTASASSMSAFPPCCNSCNRDTIRSCVLISNVVECHLQPILLPSAKVGSCISSDSGLALDFLIPEWAPNVALPPFTHCFCHSSPCCLHLKWEIEPERKCGGEGHGGLEWWSIRYSKFPLLLLSPLLF